MRLAFVFSIQEAHIAELRRQNEALRAENAKLQQELADWPRKALDHALEAREREKKFKKVKNKH